MVCLGNESKTSVIFDIDSSTAFRTLIDYEGYSISSKGFSPTVVDTMVIWINSLIPAHFSSLILRQWCSLLPSPALPCPIYLDSWPNIPSFYAIVFFIASDFTFTTRHIHNWALFLLWPSCIILSRGISNYPLLFPGSILDIFQPGGLISFCLFILLMRFSWQEYWSGLPFPPLVGYILSELFNMTHPCRVTLHSMAHSFIELTKLLCHDKAMIHVREE